MKKIRLALVFLLPLAFTSINVYAEENEIRLYNLELIIFKYKDFDYFNSEAWPQQWNEIDTSSSLDFQYPKKQAFVRPPILDNAQQIKMAKLFKRLSNEEKKLSDTSKALEESSRYELLAYHAWQQPGLSNEIAIPVRVRSQNNFRELQTVSNNIVLTDETDANQVEINDHYELDGTVTLKLSRFLHIHFDLRLFVPVTLRDIEQSEEDLGESQQRQEILLSNTENPDAKLFGINFKDHRRMRSNELHHIDHPLLGAIVLATPVKKN